MKKLHDIRLRELIGNPFTHWAVLEMAREELGRRAVRGNPQLYARILRLSLMVNRPSVTQTDIKVMDQIVRETIAIDGQLVWC